MSIEGHTNARIGAYLLGEEIGRGGMGVVYRATHVHLGRDVALKLLAPELSGNEEFRRRFLRESRLAASLDHPNIVTVYDAGDADGTLYIAMRYIAGADLAQYLRDQGPLDPLAALSLLDQVAAALDAAHERGLIHRDVKPANVMIASGRCYLTDFGLTKQASATGAASALTKTGSFLGTLNYTAPEQIEGREITASADLYALGCVLQECLTGAPPFTKDSEVALLYAHLQEPPPPPSSVRPELPPAIDGVMAKALAKSPAERYGSCGEFMAAARSAVTPGPAIPTQPSAPPTLAAQPPTVLAQPPTVPAQAKETVSPMEAATRREASPTIVRRAGEEPSTQTPEAGELRRPASRRRIGLLAVGVAVLAAAIVGIVIAIGGGSSKPAHGSASSGPAGGANSGSPSGASSGSPRGATAISGAIKVGNSPDGFASRTVGGKLWVANAGAGTIAEINEPSRTTVATFQYASHSNQAAPLVYWQGYLWVGDTSAGAIERIKPQPGTGQMMKIGSPIQVGGQPYAMTVAPKNSGNLWVASYDTDTIAFIKPGSTQATVIHGLGNGPKRMAESRTILFVANRNDGKVTEVDPFTGKLLGTINVGGNPTAINYDNQRGALWVVDGKRDTVTRFSIAAGTRIGSPITVGSDPRRLTSKGGQMWVANFGDGTVTPINEMTGQRGPSVHVGSHPDAVTASGGVIWVALWSQPNLPQSGGPPGGSPGGVKGINASTGTLLQP